DDVTLPVLAFRGSPTFTQRSDPTDGQGRVFWNPAADTGSYTAVTLPDTATPPGSDRAYVATFTLTDIPLNLSLELQSDDGVWVWLNGTAVGHWGGAWQQEGCVNENANCLVTTVVPPIDVTSLLVPGTNTLAARVSNSVENNFFEIIPRCIEPL
ncbi:MAG: beta galactosidase jelly roll domain-containing protein, partial [Alphaproteobacteria bacterium]|nr:beta galactosidase jelly roll domain-containing protein [Alphaproteobacteria bacterium]